MGDLASASALARARDKHCRAFHLCTMGCFSISSLFPFQSFFCLRLYWVMCHMIHIHYSGKGLSALRLRLRCKRSSESKFLFDLSTSGVFLVRFSSDLSG